MLNPFINSGFYRYYLAYEFLDNTNVVVDIGSGNGKFIGVCQKGKRLYGCEVDLLLVKNAKSAYSHVNFKIIDKKDKLPYPDSFADTVFLLEVIEHVDDPRKLIAEISRILKKDGVLILSTPHKGLTGWVDWGNLKFKAPVLHRLLINLFRGKEYYKTRYKSGMHGDMSKNLKEHHHFTLQELQKLIEGKFRIEKFVTHGLFLPFLMPLRDVWKILFKNNNLLNRLIMLDGSIFQGKNIGWDIVIKAKKIG